MVKMYTFVVHFSVNNKWFTDEPVLAKDIKGAHRMAAYIRKTVARQWGFDDEAHYQISWTIECKALAQFNANQPTVCLK